MSGAASPPPQAPEQEPPHTQRNTPRAILRRKRRFSLFWLIPLICGAIGLYLVFTTFANRGPLITITFKTANGITAQQTQVQHKAVALGTVEDVRLSKDMSHVVIHVRMNRQGERVLTSNARFWVVRPRLTPGNISGLETLVSGAYIEVDPGLPGGTPETHFTGLEDPPGKRSDEPGRTFVLHAKSLGSIAPGSPVFYRDVSVGEVLSYDLGNGLGPVTINLFVRDPFDKFVRDNTHFWNTSGISVGVGAEGLHFELTSIQALLSGGVAFETPTKVPAPVSAEDHQFWLFENKAEADAAGFSHNIHAVAYFESSVSGLTSGSPVEIFGIQLGTVTHVNLVMNRAGDQIRARVAFDIQPARAFPETKLDNRADDERIAASLVHQGMRAVLESSNFVTGQKDIALQFVPNAPPAQLGMEGDAFLLPSQSGGLDNITNSVSDILAKINAIPFESIGANLNKTLASVSSTLNGPDLKNALRKLSATMTDAQHLIHNTDQGMQPLLKKLPQISKDVQQAVARANSALGENGYGGNSDFQRSMMNLLDQVNDAARSIRLLADFLDRHPEALIRGRTAQATER